MGQFSEIIGRLTGGEAENLSDLQLQMEKAQAEVERCGNTEEAIREELEALEHLDAVSRLDLARLEELQTRFTETQRDLETARNQQSSLEAEMKGLASVFTGAATTEELNRRSGDIDLGELDIVYPDYIRKQQQLWAAEGTLSHLRTDGTVHTFELEAKDLGIDSKQPESMTGGSIDKNLEMLRNILEGTSEGSQTDTVLLNAAAAMATADGDIATKLVEARTTLSSGAALRTLNDLVQVSQELASQT